MSVSLLAKWRLLQVIFADARLSQSGKIVAGSRCRPLRSAVRGGRYGSPLHQRPGALAERRLLGRRTGGARLQWCNLSPKEWTR